MSNEFTIVTAVTPEYLQMLYWGIGSWVYKPQLKDKPLIVYYNGLKEKDLQFVRKVYPEARFIEWKMEGITSKSELMFSSFVFGACEDVKTPYYIKLDADAYCSTSDKVFDDGDFQYDIIGHRWGYTKPGWFLDRLDHFYTGKINPVSIPDEKFHHKRFESYCCLHRTEWVRQISKKFNGRLPVPSHDTTLWYYADKEGKWGAKNLQKLGMHNARNWKVMREAVCSGDVAFNPILNEELMSHIQLEITSKCNIGCHQCDRNCGTVPAGLDMTFVQLWNFIDRSIMHDRKYRRLDVIGGEPTLHPQLIPFLDAIKIYKDKFPKCSVRLSTNGLGEKVTAALDKIPSWVNVRNSSKESANVPHKIYHDAPIDHNVTEVKACSVPWRCGIAMTPYGFFPCGAGASLARVFGLDIGIKNFEDLKVSNIKKQMTQLCKYCGHSNSIEQTVTKDGSEMSSSWIKAMEDYDHSRMSLM